MILKTVWIVIFSFFKGWKSFSCNSLSKQLNILDTNISSFRLLFSFEKFISLFRYLQFLWEVEGRNYLQKFHGINWKRVKSLETQFFFFLKHVSRQVCKKFSHIFLNADWSFKDVVWSSIKIAKCPLWRVFSLKI